jgi:hypothetical protein
MAAFPIGVAAIGADITPEFAFSRVPAVGTFEFVRFILHFFHLSNLCASENHRTLV